MPVSQTTPGRSGACDDVPDRVAFRLDDGVSTQVQIKFSRLNGWPMRSPADASPTPSRAPAHGSGADVVRYSFIAVDFHHLLLAGLPAHHQT